MANKLLTITTPRGCVHKIQTKSGKVSVRMEWAEGFGPDWTKHLQGVQAMFDTEVMRLTDPYVPMDTGMLKNTAKMASEIGTGELVYATPYASAQYYRPGRAGSSTGALRGPYWGERMKADHLEHLAAFVRKAVSGS